MLYIMKNIFELVKKKIAVKFGIGIVLFIFIGIGLSLVSPSTMSIVKKEVTSVIQSDTTLLSNLPTMDISVPTTAAISGLPSTNQPTVIPTTPKIIKSSYDITGVVFQDDNGDGIKDANEKGIANWEVSAGRDLGYTRTDSNGNYVINNKPGKYMVSVPQNAYALTTPQFVDINLEQNTTVNFGLKKVAEPTPVQMKIQKVTVLGCNTTTCQITVNGTGFADDAYVYLYRTDDRIDNSLRAYSHENGKANLTEKVGDTQLTSNFQGLVCGHYYLNVYSPGGHKNADDYGIDLRSYICK
jgi:hypothetical protein